jgi:hypothetical protein
VGLGVALLLAGCGSSSSSSSSSTAEKKALPTPGSLRAGADAPLPAAARAAERVSASQFPAAKGRSLQQLADTATAGPQFAAASAQFTPGLRRLSFGLIDRAGKPVYGDTAVYVARRPGAPAAGPFVAPADPLVVQARYRSKTTAGSDIKAIYAAQVRFREPGSHAVLVLTRTPKGLIGAAGQVKVARSSAIPDVGARAPRIHTPTVASVHGDIAKIDTRLPHDDMHKLDLYDVEGKRPVALIISTPALCQSRVCGPVTDVIAELEPRYRSRMAFIHQEVYRDNQLSEGLRPQLKAFHLQTEPWLFVLDRHGRIAARVEGAFGFHAAERALNAGLKG